MMVYLIYIDESRDPEFNVGVFSALTIPISRWHESFQQVIFMRRDLKESDGIYVKKEFHASNFVGGRGRIAPHTVSKCRRCQIFHNVLEIVAELPEVRLFNAIFTLSQEDLAFEYLLNRINRTMRAWGENSDAWGDYAILICDEGKQAAYTKLRRRMGVYNPIPSMRGTWPSGSRTQNITIDRIVEDPIFKDSRYSYFIQLVDFCAYALLRRTAPVESKTRYGLHVAFNILSGILVTEAVRSDPEGIIRVGI